MSANAELRWRRRRGGIDIVARAGRWPAAQQQHQRHSGVTTRRAAGKEKVAPASRCICYHQRHCSRHGQPVDDAGRFYATKGDVEGRAPMPEFGGRELAEQLMMTMVGLCVRCAPSAPARCRRGRSAQQWRA